MDKIKDKLHIGSSNNTSNTSGTAEGVSGPHSTRTANALDPRVDSDRDNSTTVGNTGYGSNTGTAGGYGSTTGAGYGSTTGGTAEGTSGPHGSRIANALDPRVDSDRDNSATVGGTGYGAGTTGQHHHHGTTGGFGGPTGVTGTGFGSATDPSYGSTTGGTAEGMSGPHGSRIANTLDPRVDSDRDNSATLGGGAGYSSATGAGAGVGAGTGTGFAGGVSNSTNAGPHNSNLANKLDPRVDSDLDHRGNRHANQGGVFGASGSHATAGPGTAQNTAGPHNSDWANKLDPRVDSTRTNNTTLGGNQTYA